MKLKFNGLVETRSHGCRVCGHKATSEHVFVARRRYFLPSGSSMYFVKDETYEVSDSDAEFLLSYQYTDPQGVVHHVFEVVDGDIHDK